jgi:hypothetical protein
VGGVESADHISSYLLNTASLRVICCALSLDFSASYLESALPHLLQVPDQHTSNFLGLTITWPFPPPRELQEQGILVFPVPRAQVDQ